MERFKEALGEGQKISALEGIISKFWGRFSKLNSEGVEIGSNSRLQNELKSLTQKMDGALLLAYARPMRCPVLLCNVQY
eukprot:3938198-Rhodomonas_salina.1